MSALLLKPSDGTGEVVTVTQERAGWQTISLRLLRIEKGQKQAVSQPGEELALVMLAGQATGRARGPKQERPGGAVHRFAGLPHTPFLPLAIPPPETSALH